MKIVSRGFLLSLLLLFAFGSQASVLQGTKKSADSTSMKGLYLGAHASTNGWGFNAKYAVNNWLAFKTGYETLSLSYDFDFDESDISFVADLDYSTGGILMLADLSYAKNLYVSTGIILNSFNPSVKGMAAEDYNFGDITIKAEDLGSFTFDIEPSLKASPYIGAGYQAFWGKRDRVVFNFETGLYYMGAPDFKLSADGLLEPTADPALGQEEYLESQFDAYKIYPVIKLNLAVKLF